MEEINKTKIRFLEKTNKIDKSLARLPRKNDRGHKLKISEMKKHTSLQVLQTLRG